MWRIFVLTGLNFLDFWTTYIGLMKGAVEQNPIVNIILSVFGWHMFLAFKISLVVSVYYFIRKMCIKHAQMKVYHTSAYISMALLFAIVVSNIMVISL